MAGITCYCTWKAEASLLSQIHILYQEWRIALTSLVQQHLSVRFELYENKVMSFGLRSVPVTFQRLMNMLGLEGCAVYLDDVVFSDTGDNNIQCICPLLGRLAEALQ